ncbi:protein FAM186A [Tupaia chinensis]|uniref:protein FAM186A n=1 Tax=Tupaia chinensis TaxID=246437 RepID=UPI0003C8F4DA|nr:protein FAM186A [Tupaia chinensis]
MYEIDSDSESENEAKDSIMMKRKSENTILIPEIPELEIPFSVQDILSRITEAQLYRAREDIDMQLNYIMNNVQRIINRYTIDLNPPSGRNISVKEYNKIHRASFSEKLSSHAKAIESREKTLARILAWLEEWNATLSEMTIIDADERHHWIAQMEMLPDTFKAIENNVKILIRISASLIEEKKKQKKKIQIRGALWKSWKDRVIKRPATAHALRPDQMISDQFATNTKVSEIQDMLQELIGTSMFSKLENNAIKYISSTMMNLSKALSALNDEIKVISSQSTTMYVEETSEAEKEFSLKIIQDLIEENELLQHVLKVTEEKHEQLLRSKAGSPGYIVLPMSSTSKVPPGASPPSSMATIKASDKEDSIDSILVKQFEIIVDEAQSKGTKVSGVKWDSAIAYTAQAEMTPELTVPEKKQKMPPEDTTEEITERKPSLKKADVPQKEGTDHYRPHKKKQTKVPHVQEPGGSNLGEEKVLETKLSQYPELQALEKKRKEIKSLLEDSSIETKSQGGKGGVSSLWEQLKKAKSEYLHDKSLVSTALKVEPPTESTNKESKIEMIKLVEPVKTAQPDSEPKKVKTKGKKQQPSLGTTKSKEEKTEEKEVLDVTKQLKPQQLVKSGSRVAKETSESTRIPESPGRKSEQSILEEFQKAIMTFLKEKIDNLRKPSEKKTELKEEMLLKRAEVEKLGLIKAKMEEYFQKVAETVTKILRKYKDVKKERETGEKPMKQKKVAFTPGLHSQRSQIGATSEISTFLSRESLDPITDYLLQMILAEIESERDVSIAQKMKKRRREEYLQAGQEKIHEMSLKHQLLEERDLWKEGYEMTYKNLEDRKESLKGEKPRQKKHKQGQEEELEEYQKQKIQKQISQKEKQKLGGKEREEHEKPKQQQLEAGKQKMKEEGLLEESREKTRQVQKEMRKLELKITSEKEKQKPRKGVEDFKRQRESKAMDQKKIKEKLHQELVKMVTQTPMTLSSRTKSISKDRPLLQKEKEFHMKLKKLEPHPDGKYPTPITPPTSTQSFEPGPSDSGKPLKKHITPTPEQTESQGITLIPQQAQGITLTPQQAQDLGITLTPQQVQAQGITLTPQQAQDLGITLTPQQAQAQGITLTPQQAQDLGITLTPQQAQAQGITLTPQQAQDLGIILTPWQPQDLGITLTSKQAQDLGITLAPQQAQDLGITLAPQQVQAPGITLTPQQAQDLGITLTPQQVQAQGITLTPQQAQDLGITLTPQQAQAQRITLTPQQVQDLGITLTPQQAQAQGITLTPQQAQDLGITLTPQQVQAQGITLTPQQAQDLGITLTPQQAQAQGITLTPQQAQDLGITLAPQQIQAPGIILTPQQAQDLGITLTPQQIQAQRITLTPQQAQDLGITLTPQQAQAQGITLTPQQAEDLRITLTPQQAQDLGITLTPQQVQAQGITLTPQQAQDLGITLTPQQVQAQGITLTPQQAQDLGITLTPQQVQAQGITLTPQQAQDLGITLTPQQAEDLRITLTPQQAQDLGITLALQQAQAQGITLTPQQAQAQGITLTPQQVQAQGITLTPQQAQAQGITLTPQQAQDLGITLTPQQAQAQGITLTPQQAEDLRITLTPQQAQDLGITLTPQQVPVQGITLTPQQAQDLGITVTPQQVQAKGITLTPQQAQILGITFPYEQTQQTSRAPFTLEQAQPFRIPMTPKYDQTLKAFVISEQTQGMQIPTIEQAQILGVPITEGQAETKVTLTPQQPQASGVTLTPEYLPVLKPPLTSVQAQSLQDRLVPEQAQALMFTLTPEKARALGITLTPDRDQAVSIALTPDQAQALGIALTEEQAWKLGVPITSEKVQEASNVITLKQLQALGITPSGLQAQALGSHFTLEQAQALGIPVTPEDAWLSAFTRTPEQTQVLPFPITLEQAQALGIPLSQEQLGKLRVPLTSDESPLTLEQVQRFSVPFTPRQAQSVGTTLMSEQDLKSRAPLTDEQPSQLWARPFSGHTPESGTFSVTDESIIPSAPQIPEQIVLSDPSTLRTVRELKVSPPTEQSITTRLSPSSGQSLAFSVPTAEKSIFGVSSTPLQVPRPPLIEAPLTPKKSPGMGVLFDPRKPLAPQIIPSSRKTLVYKDGSFPAQFLAPEIPPTSGQLSIPGAPPSPEQPLEFEAIGSRQFFTSRSSLTPRLPLISKTPPSPRQPLVARAPSTSRQIPSLWAPLSPGQPPFLGASSIPEEQLEYEPLTQATRPPGTPEQSPYLWAPSTLGQHLTPWTLPEQASTFRITPTLRYPSTLWGSTTPVKPQKELSSSVTKKRLAMISSLKSKLPLVHPSAPDTTVRQTPFTTKFQMPAVSDTTEETQILQDTFAMEPFKIFKSYFTKYRTPVSQPPCTDEEALPALIKTIRSLPSLTAQLPKSSQITPPDWDQKSRFPPIDKSWILTSVLGTKKAKMMVSPSTTPQELEEKRYFLDVEAQRQNLILLNQATKTSGLPSQLHATARTLIIETLRMDTVRLGYLFRKYIAYRLIQRARNNIIKRLKAIRNSGKGYEIQDLYKMLNRIDDYQKKVMQVWTEKLKSLEEKRNQNLRKMIPLFSQLQELHKLNLSKPTPLIIDKKQIPVSTKLAQQPFLELLVEEDRQYDIIKRFRQEDQTEAIWNAELSTSSYPITEKASIHSLWAQLGGYPDTPRLLQLDVQSTFRKSLASIQSQLKKIPK